MSFVFTWLLLSSSADLTCGQDDSVTEGITVEIKEKTQNQVTTTEASSAYAHLSVLHSDTTLSMAEGSLTEEATYVQTTTQKTSSIPTQTTSTSTDTTLSWINTSALNMSRREEPIVVKSTTMDGTSQVGNSTEFTMTSSKLSSSTQRLDTEKTSTIIVTRSKTPGPSAQATSIAFPSTTSTNTEEGKSDGTSPATSSSGGLTQATSSVQTSFVVTIIPITKPKKTTKLEGDKDKPNTGKYHSKVVAGLIGGSLLIMMAGFLIIFLKKRRLQKQKLTSKDWAGPSPFLESGSNNSDIERQSSNRISLSSFLPQRLSKRLSLLPEADEEMEDMAPTITFGSQHSENLNGKKTDGNGVQERNGFSVVVADVKLTDDPTEPGETNQTKQSRSTNNTSEATALNQKQSDNSPDLSESGEKSQNAN